MTKYWVTWDARYTKYKGMSLGSWELPQAKAIAKSLNRAEGHWVVHDTSPVDWPTPREPEPVPTGDFMGMNRMYAFAVPVLFVMILIVLLILGG